MKKLTAFILALTLLSISDQSVIACSSILTPPEAICIELENHNPKSQGFKTCMFKLLEMGHGEFLKRYDPCHEGPVLLIKDYSLEIKKRVLTIEKEYAKKTEKENNGVN